MPRAARSKTGSKRWVRVPADLEAIRQGYYFDEEAAEHVCGFFSRFLRHTTTRKWAGRPFELQPWQRDYLSRLYGWKRADGTRRFRESYLEVPKKNGKSSMVSGLCLYGMFEEPGAEVYQGASNRKQSGIVYREAARMVAASPDLKDLLRVLPSKNTISFAAGNARLKALSADADSEDGANSSLTVLDEVHRFGNRRLYDVMQYAGAARDQPLLVSITTAGTDRHSLCWELHERARAIIEGSTEDLEFLGVIYGCDPEKDDLDDPRIWRKANPSLGVIISEADFSKEYAQAKRIPGRLNNFLRLRLGIWTEQATRWLSTELWDQAADPVGLDWWKGQEAYAALDISSVSDLAALTLYADAGDHCRIASFFFLPEETVERRSEVDGVPYVRWIQEGHAIETPGNATDHEAIRRKLNDLVEQGVSITRVGMDPWNAAHLANLLADDGFQVEMIRQGYATLSGPAKELERRLLAGKIRHDGNPCMRWCVGNVATETDAAGNIKPSKAKSTERIDGVASLVMVLCLAITYPGSGDPTFTVIGQE
jgi:phage terminase large subunit-like protein